MKKILINKIKCNLCGDEIESTSRHDMKWCKCGSCAVDGGHDYLRRCYKTPEPCFTDMSETKESKGHWIFIGRKNGTRFYKCSLCGATISTEADIYDEMLEQDNEICYNCGTDMF